MYKSNGNVFCYVNVWMRNKMLFQFSCDDWNLSCFSWEKQRKHALFSVITSPIWHKHNYRKVSN